MNFPTEYRMRTEVHRGKSAAVFLSLATQTGIITLTRGAMKLLVFSNRTHLFLAINVEPSQTTAMAHLASSRNK